MGQRRGLVSGETLYKVTKHASHNKNGAPYIDT